MQRHGFKKITCQSIVNRYAMNYFLKMLPLPGIVKSTLVRSVDGLKMGGGDRADGGRKHGNVCPQTGLIPGRIAAEIY